MNKKVWLITLTIIIIITLALVLNLYRIGKERIQKDDTEITFGNSQIAKCNLKLGNYKIVADAELFKYLDYINLINKDNSKTKLEYFNAPVYGLGKISDFEIKDDGIYKFELVLSGTLESDKKKILIWDETNRFLALFYKKSFFILFLFTFMMLIFSFVIFMVYLGFKNNINTTKFYSDIDSIG